MKFSALAALIGVSSAQTWCSSTEDCLGEDFYNDGATCCIRKTVVSVPEEAAWGRFATDFAGCGDDGCGREMTVGNSWTECETEAYITQLATYPSDAGGITYYDELDNNWVTYMTVFPEEKELFGVEEEIDSTDSWITTWESDVDTAKAAILDVQCMDAANATGLAAGIATVAAAVFATI